jgi:hypothetical protein
MHVLVNTPNVNEAMREGEMNGPPQWYEQEPEGVDAEKGGRGEELGRVCSTNDYRS